MSDPLLRLYVAYKAHMAEHTGLSWEDIEKFLAADRAFWTARPGAAALMKQSGLDTPYH